MLRRSEPTRFSSASDDEVGGFPSAIRSERSEQSETVHYAAHMSLLPAGWIHP